MNYKKNAAISRREFARRAAIASAVASIAPAEVFATEKVIAASQSEQGPPAPKLSPESQTEAEARFQNILSQFGGRFSEAQKADLKRLCFLAQPPLDRLRAYAIENGDGAALYLKPLLEHEKKFGATPAQGNLPDAAKKH
jgi:hypothetical protein